VEVLGESLVFQNDSKIASEINPLNLPWVMPAKGADSQKGLLNVRV